MTFTLVDILLVLIFVGVCVWAVVRGLLRQTLSLGVLFFTTAIVGFGYPYVGYYFQAIGGRRPILTEGIVFIVLFIILAVALEVLLQKALPNTRLPKLGIFDNILALAPGALCALIIIALLLSAIGYATSDRGGAISQAAWHASLRPFLGRFMETYMATHTLWFPTPPPLLGYLIPSGLR